MDDEVLKKLLISSGLPLEIKGKRIFFFGQAFDPVAVPVKIDFGAVIETQISIKHCTHYYLVLKTDKGRECTYCGFGDYWHFEQDGKIYVGKIKVQDGKDEENGG